MTYSPKKKHLSTIGAGGLNFCVRDGNRWDPSAIITGIIHLFEITSRLLTYVLSKLYSISKNFPSSSSAVLFLSSSEDSLVKPSTY